MAGEQTLPSITSKKKSERLTGFFDSIRFYLLLIALMWGNQVQMAIGFSSRCCTPHRINAGLHFVIAPVYYYLLQSRLSRGSLLFAIGHAPDEKKKRLLEIL
jgi:hypothetical protein